MTNSDILHALASLTPRPVKRKTAPVVLSKEGKERYLAAHRAWFAIKYPLAYQGNHYTPPKMPKKLDVFIGNYLKWSGIEVSGEFKTVEGFFEAVDGCVKSLNK